MHTFPVTRIDAETIETLLNMPESQTLDFKAAQYPVVGAADEQKGELVKDILAFANAWKDTDAHILIGVRDNHAPPATVIGGITHVDDATLQELVNKKTNRAVHFEYIPLECDGRAIAAIRIRKEQDRPVFLRKAFGKLKPNVVYVRRGSSTFEADPDEVAKMGRVASAPSPVLSLGIRELERRGTAGVSVTLVSKLLEERPPIPPEERAAIESALGSNLRSMLAMRESLSSRMFTVPLHTKPSRDEIHRFLTEQALLRAVVVVVDNPGQVLAADVRVELRFPVAEGTDVRDEPPAPPRGRFELVVPHSPAPNYTSVEKVDDEWKVSLHLGKIQPGTVATSDPFWIGCSSPLSLTLSASIVGDNFSPIDSELSIELEVEHGWLEDAEDAYDDEASARGDAG